MGLDSIQLMEIGWLELVVWWFWWFGGVVGPKHMQNLTESDPRRDGVGWEGNKAV